jgi:hypothetical protein
MHTPLPCVKCLLIAAIDHKGILVATDMHTSHTSLGFFAGAKNSSFCSAIAALIVLSASPMTDAAIFRCVDANGVNTFSDRTCDTKKDVDAVAAAGESRGGSDTFAHRPDSAREKIAAQILELLRIAPAEPETPVMRRTVDDAAPDLVKGLDPDNANWTPANGRWHMVSEFVKSDLRKDVQSSLRTSTSQVSRITAREYAAHAKDVDMEALLAFLKTPDGTRYVAFQNELRPQLYSALSAVQAQEPIPETPISETDLRQRKRLLSMALEYRVFKEGGGPSTAELQPGSPTIMENAARREGTALDTMYAEYQAFLAPLQAFADSETARHFYAAIEPALRTELALSSTATTDFAEQEFDRYVQRWRAYYGPGVRVTTRTTVNIRGRFISYSQTTQTNNMNIATRSAESMALQCEQREGSAYQQSHGSVRDYNAQALAMKAIQSRCRAEQHLPSL